MSSAIISLVMSLYGRFLDPFSPSNNHHYALGYKTSLSSSLRYPESMLIVSCRWYTPNISTQVRAVWKDELRKYCDVIVFSTQGDRSLASMLGGGDYDGGENI